MLFAESEVVGVLNQTNTSVKRGKRVKWGAWAAITAGVLTWVLTPPMDQASCTSHGGGMNCGGWLADLLRPLFWPYIQFAPMDKVYQTFGRTFLVIYLLMVAGLVALHGHLAGRLTPWGEKGYRVARTGLTLLVVGMISDYWLGYEVLGQWLWGMGFTIFTVGGFLTYMVGMALMGYGARAAVEGWLVWLLAVGPATGFVTHPLAWNVPSGPTLSSGLVWLVIGVYLLTRRPGASPVRDRTPKSQRSPSHSEMTAFELC
jgi:hypothetical protein